jgi:hypothetical protein
MKVATFIALAALSMAAQAAQAAETIDWKGCDKEIKEFKCTGDDKTVWSCLEKHDDKLGASCQKVHEKGDKIFKK